MSIAGLIIISGKPRGFIVGADIREFDQLDTEAKVKEAVAAVNAMLDRLEAFKIPAVCAIHGNCLGGGLELALACSYRIATRADETRIGFPEVKLGIFPGFNGTARSIRQAGAVAAMQAMLTGRMIRASAARAMGLIDELVPNPERLRWAARKAVLQKRRSKPAPMTKRVMRQWPARGVLAKKMRTETAKKAREDHYPAPFRLIDLFENHGGDLGAMKRAETDAFAPLMVSDTVAQPAPRVCFVGRDEGAGAEGARLQAAARPRHRRRRHGRRYRGLVRCLRHAGLASGLVCGTDREGHQGAGQASSSASSAPSCPRRRRGPPHRRP